MDNTIDALILLLQIGALWAFLAFAVKDYALDKLRQNLFAIRGSLFDNVHETAGGFTDPAYVHLRTYINQVIRRGHMVSPSQSVVASCLAHLPLVTGGVSAAEIRDDMNARVAELIEMDNTNPRIKEVRTRVHFQLLQYYALTSPIFLIALIVLVLGAICVGGAMGIHLAAQQVFSRFFASDVDRGISMPDDSDQLPVGC